MLKYVVKNVRVKKVIINIPPYAWYVGWIVYWYAKKIFNDLFVKVVRAR